jgi:hypothetical protein
MQQKRDLGNLPKMMKIFILYLKLARRPATDVVKTHIKPSKYVHNRDSYRLITFNLYIVGAFA